MKVRLKDIRVGSRFSDLRAADDIAIVARLEKCMTPMGAVKTWIHMVGDPARHPAGIKVDLGILNTYWQLIAS